MGRQKVAPDITNVRRPKKFLEFGGVGTNPLRNKCKEVATPEEKSREAALAQWNFYPIIALLGCGNRCTKRPEGSAAQESEFVVKNAERCAEPGEEPGCVIHCPRLFRIRGGVQLSSYLRFQRRNAPFTLSWSLLCPRGTKQGRHAHNHGRLILFLRVMLELVPPIGKTWAPPLCCFVSWQTPREALARGTTHENLGPQSDLESTRGHWVHNLHIEAHTILLM